MPKHKKPDGVLAGCDSGTGTTYIAVIHPDGRREVLPDPHGDIPTLSAIGFDKGDPALPVIGKAARNLKKLYPHWVASTNKRLRGKGGPEGVVALIDKDNRPWTAEELETLLLKILLSHAEEILGLHIEGVLMTVPACFNDPERKATKEIVETSGAKFLGLISEPSAAILGYLKDRASACIAIVFDEGKGTSDTTVMKVKKTNEFEVLATKGRDDLAGREMTLSLLQHCVSHAEAKGMTMTPDTHPQDYVLLEDAAEEAKIALSAMDKTTIVWRIGADLFDIEVTRAEFEALIAPIIQAIRELIMETLSAAKIKPEDVDIVVPAGGGSRTPAVRALLEDIFGPDKVMKNIDPDRAVILGALEAIPIKVKEAIHSGQTDIEDIVPDHIIDSKLSLTDVLGDALGIRAERSSDGATVLAPVVNANAALPCSTERVFGLKQDNGQMVTADIVVLQGAADRPVDEARTLEVFPLENLPSGPTANRIAVRFDVDSNGLVSVHARDTFSGKEIRGTAKAHKHNPVDSRVR